MKQGTRADHVMQARIYLAQARHSRMHPGWHATLLRWAANRRREAAATAERVRECLQGELF